MKFIFATALVCGVLALTIGGPLPVTNPDSATKLGIQPKTDIELMKIPLDGDKELDVITLVSSEDPKINERNKRTIGILRELFPTISQILDQKIQMITSYLFRTIGPILLRSGLGLNGGKGESDNNHGSSFSDDADDFDFDDEDDSVNNDKEKDTPNVSISLPTFPPPDDTDDKATTKNPLMRLGDERNEDGKLALITAVMKEPVNNDRIDLIDGQFDNEAFHTAESITYAFALAEQTTSRTTAFNLITSNENANTLETLDLTGLSDTLHAIRVIRAASEEKSASSNDQNTADSTVNSSSLDELTLDSEGNDEDRNKRFLSFGGSSGGGGGSGNFLFDIIRRAADRAARAAGTVYRVVAGTESLTTVLETDDCNDDGHSTSSSATSHSYFPLVSGSSGTEQSDEKAHSPDDHDLGKGDGYTEGIPGPVTRLFVLANRGLSNLIQDLILRIAQTSERVVNFKARLITSLI